jgi:hypothetical protein
MHLGFWLVPALFSVVVAAMAVFKPGWYWDGHPSMRRMRAAIGEVGATVLFVAVSVLLAGMAVVVYLGQSAG